MHPDELSLVLCPSRCISKDSSSRGTMCLVPILMQATHHQTNYKCCPNSCRRLVRLYYKNGVDALSFWTDDAPSSIWPLTHMGAAPNVSSRAALQFLRPHYLDAYSLRTGTLFSWFSSTGNMMNIMITFLETCNLVPSRQDN